MPTSPTDPLVTVAELPRYGVPSAFVEQFRPRRIQVKIYTGGALGTMAYVWRPVGEDDYTNTEVTSDPGSTWESTIEAAFCTLTFAAGTYVVNTTYTVAVDGTVTDGVGAISGVTATRFDLRSTAVSAATNEALALMRDGVTLPLTAWGDDVKMHCASLAHEHLKASKGFTANQAGAGDENAIARALAARRYFADIGQSGIIPPGITDSATAADGPIFGTITSDDARGW